MSFWSNNYTACAESPSAPFTTLLCVSPAAFTGLFVGIALLFCAGAATSLIYGLAANNLERSRRAQERIIVEFSDDDSADAMTVVSMSSF